MLLIEGAPSGVCYRRRAEASSECLRKVLDVTLGCTVVHDRMGSDRRGRSKRGEGAEEQTDTFWLVTREGPAVPHAIAPPWHHLRQSKETWTRQSLMKETGTIVVCGGFPEQVPVAMQCFKKRIMSYGALGLSLPHNSQCKATRC